MTEQEIRTTAFIIWQEKERLNIPSSPEQNWEEAIQRLELMDMIHRGRAGE